jgi:hypothetical protein
MTTPKLPEGAYVVQGVQVPPPPPPKGAVPPPDDIKTGAPKSLRAIVSAYKKPGDKLEIIQKYYPEAYPYGKNNFVFKNPENNNVRTLFNPEGLELGDIYEYGRIGAEIVGAVGGGLAGGLVTSPTVAGIPAGVLGGSVAGSVGAGETYDQFLRSVYGMGVEDTRTPKEHLRDVGIQAAIETAAPLAVGKVGRVMREKANKLFNKPEAKAIHSSAKNLGVDNLPLGVSTGSGVARLENQLSSTVGGGNVIAKNYANSMQQLNLAIKNLTDDGRSLSTQQAGDIILDGAKRFDEVFDATSNKLYDELTDAINPNLTFSLPNTEKILKEIEFKFDDPELAKLFGEPYAKSLQTILTKSPEFSYRDIKALRTATGQKTQGTVVIGTSPNVADIRRIYGALTDDMFSAADSLGGDVALLARQANDYYNINKNLIDNFIQPYTTKRGGKEYLPPEQVYAKVMKDLESKGSQANKFLDTVFNPTLGNEQYLNIIGQKQFFDLTRDMVGKESVYSPAKTLSNLNRLFKSTGEYPTTIQTLGTKVDDVYQVSKGFKEASKTYNFSNTAHTAAFNQLFGPAGFGSLGYLATGDIGTGLATGAMQVGGPNLVARLITSPKTSNIFKNWATKADIPLDAKISVLTGIGFSGPQAQRFINNAYVEPLLPEPVTTQQQDTTPEALIPTQ